MVDEAVRADQSFVCGRLIRPVDALRSSAEHGQDLGGLAGEAVRAREVCGGGLEGLVVLQRQASEALADFVVFESGADQPALAFLARSRGSAEAVHVLLAAGGCAHLDDVGDVRVVHSSGCDVRGEEDAALATSETLRSTLSLSLAQPGVDLVNASGVERMVSGDGERRGLGVIGTSEFLKDGCKKVRLLVGIAENDGLEWAGVVFRCLCNAGRTKLEQSGNGICQTSDGDAMLRHPGVRGLLVVLNCLYDLEARLESLEDQVLDLWWYGSAEHEGLAVDFLAIGEQGHEVLNVLPEALIKQTVRFVKDKSTQTRR